MLPACIERCGEIAGAVLARFYILRKHDAGLEVRRLNSVGGVCYIKKHMKIQLSTSYYDIVSVENLIAAWKEFLPGKRNKRDVQFFARDLMHNIIQLHDCLVNMTYAHEGYESFNISDPKPRHIHKASVRDRLLHHAIYRQLYPFFDRKFIADSYSCRANKGTHKANERFTRLARQVSKNNTKACWVLQCDIKKFFASIGQITLIGILEQYIPDKQIMWLMKNVIRSFSLEYGKGLPLGNLTSQLFVNVYMNEFDRYVKHNLKARHYIRYADDFIILSHDKETLEILIPSITEYLSDILKLSLHPQKVHIRTLGSGVDFLGWVHFADHRILRTATRHRMLKRITQHPTNETVQSYLGLLKHGNAYGIQKELMNYYGLFKLK